jgi:hypothetical protein
MQRTDYQGFRVKGYDTPFFLECFSGEKYIILDPRTKEDAKGMVRTLSRMAKEIEMRIPELPWGSPPPPTSKPGRDLKGRFVKSVQRVGATLRSWIALVGGDRPWKFHPK